MTHNDISDILFLFLSLSTILGITLSYFSLSSLIKKYHPNRYIEIKTSLSYFFLLETLPLSIDFANNFIQVGHDLKLNISTPFRDNWRNANNILWCIYPVIQAIGMLFVKESKDPL